MTRGGKLREISLVVIFTFENFTSRFFARFGQKLDFLSTDSRLEKHVFEADALEKRVF